MSPSIYCTLLGEEQKNTQQQFLMTETEIVNPQQDDKAEFWDIAALEHN